MQSSKTHDVLNSCDVFLNETPDLYCNFDSLRTTYLNLQRRWQDICTKSEQRKVQTDDLYRDWSKFNEEYLKMQLWIKEKTSDVSLKDVRASKVNYDNLAEIETELEGLQLEQNDKISELDTLNDFYCELAREYRLDTSDDLKTKFIKINHDWENLANDLDNLLRRIRHSRQLFQNYSNIREREMNYLRRLDAQLTELEFSSALDYETKRSNLAKIKSEFISRSNFMQKVEEGGMHLVQRSELKDAERVEELTQEFKSLQCDVSSRLENLVDRLSPPDLSSGARSDEEDLPPISVNSSIQVDTLKFERDAGVQADTLLTQSVLSMPDSGVSTMSYQTTHPLQGSSQHGAEATISPVSHRGLTPFSDDFYSKSHEDRTTEEEEEMENLMERFVREYEEEERNKTATNLTSVDLKDGAAILKELDRFINETKFNLEKLDMILKVDDDDKDEGPSFQDMVRIELNLLCYF